MACSSYSSDVTGGKTYTQSSGTGSALFDNNVNNGFILQSPSYPQWVGVDLGSGKDIQKLRLYPQQFPEYGPSEFKLKGSTTGAFSGEEVTVLDIIGLSWSNETWKVWEFSNPVKYRYYRIYFEDGSSSWLTMYEAEMMECLDITTTTTTTTTTTSSTASTSSGSSTVSTLSTTSSTSTSSSTSTTMTAPPPMSYCVFRDVTIPPGSVISKANVYLTSYSTDVDTPVEVDVYFSDEDNAPPPISTDDLDGRPGTVSPINWVIGDPWFDNVVYKSPNLSSILQQVIDREGWLSGNNVLGVIKFVGDLSGGDVDVTIDNPKFGGSYYAYGSWHDGNFAYSASFSYGLKSFSQDAGGNFTLIDTVNTELRHYQLWGDGNFLFDVGWWDGFYVYSVDGGGNLSLTDTFGGGYLPTDVWGDDNFIYTVDPYGGAYSGLSSWSVDGSGLLTRIDTIPSQSAFGVWSDGTFIFTVNQLVGGLKCFSVDGSGNLTLEDSDIQGTGSYLRVFGDGNFIYVVDSTNGVRSYSVDGSGNLTYIDVGYHYEGGGTIYYDDVWADGYFVYLAGGAESFQRFSVDGNGYLTYEDAYIQGDVNSIWGNANYIYTTGSNHEISAWKLNYTGVSEVEDRRFWSAIEHIGGSEKACLRAHWREPQQIQTPRFSPEEGFQLSLFNCTITTYPTDAAIYYTTDGSDPDENSTLYTVPFEVSSDTTVKARAYKQYWTTSEIGTKVYSLLSGWTFNYEIVTSVPVNAAPGVLIFSNPSEMQYRQTLWRFSNVTIPKDAVVDSASITFYPNGIYTSQPLIFDIGFEAADNPDPPGSSVPAFKAILANMTTLVEWSPVNYWGGETDPQITSSLKLPLQEIVNRSGWASGQAINFVLSLVDPPHLTVPTNPPGGDWKAYAKTPYGTGPAYEYYPQLNVVWSSPSGSGSFKPLHVADELRVYVKSYTQV